MARKKATVFSIMWTIAKYRKVAGKMIFA